MTRRGQSSPLSALPLLAGALTLLAVGVALTIALSPEKPEAPPRSEIQYSERPAERQAADTAYRDEWRPRSTGPAARSREPRSEEVQAVQAAEAEPGRPVFQIRGEVVDSESGDGVPFARLEARRQWSSSEESEWTRRNQTAVRARDDGALEALAEEERRLRHHASGIANEAGGFLIEVFEPGIYAVDVTSSRHVPATATTGDLGADKAIDELRIALSTGASVEGRVTEEGGNAGAVGVTVRVEERPSIQAETDEDGHYRLSGLAPGSYGILVTTAGTVYKTGERVPYQRIEIRDATQRLTNVNFSVEAAGVVWGYVMTPDRQEIEGAELVLSAPESILSQALSAMVTQATPVNARSGDGGYYELVGVPLNSEWRVYATADDHTPQLADPFVLTGSNKSIRVDVFMYGGTDIHGVVVDNRGDPVPSARVVCIPAYTRMLSPLDAPQAFRDATSDENGAFTIRKVPEGSYQVLARKDGYKFAAFGEPVYPDGYSDITGFRIVLNPVDEGDSRIFGVVVDPEGQPVSGASCRIEGMGSESLSAVNRETSTGSDGRFSFDGIEAGSYRLRVTAEGYAPRVVARAVIDAENRVMLENTALLAGRVLVRETRRAPEWGYTVSALPLSAESGAVNLFRLNEGRIESAFDFEDGSFQLSVPPGVYRLEGKADDLTPGRIQVTAESGEVIDGLEIFLSREGARIEGRVRTMGGSSPEGAVVNLLDLGSAAEMALAAGEGSNTMRVGADGFFSFTNLAAGTYNIIAEHPGYANGSSGPISLGEGESRTNIEIRLGSGGVLTGTVSRNNQPLVGALVLVASIDTGTTRTVNTDESGVYEIDGLASGIYEVTVTQLGSGNVSDLFDRMGGSVEVTEGQVARLDFGGTGGVHVTGSCMPGPPGFGGEVMLRSPGSPLLGGPGEPIGIDRLFNINSLYRTAASPGSGYFEIEGVMPGLYQIEVYYIMNIFTGDVRNVYAGQLEIPETNAVDVPIMVNIH